MDAITAQYDPVIIATAERPADDVLTFEQKSITPQQRTLSIASAPNVVGFGRGLLLPNTENVREYVWKTFEGEKKPWQNKISEITKNLWDDQFKVVAENLEAQGNRFASEKSVDAESFAESFVLFDWDEWLAEFSAAHLAWSEDTILSFGRATIMNLDLPAEIFSSLNAEMSDFAFLKSNTFAYEVNSTTLTKLQDLLAEAYTEGYSLSEITAELEGLHENWEDWRALRVARTETTGVSNFGINQGHKEAARRGLIEKKWWLTARDSNVREEVPAPNHRLQESLTIDEGILIDNAFPNGLLTPGVGGSAAEVCNCRCVEMPWIRTESEKTSPVFVPILWLPVGVRAEGERIRKATLYAA